MELTQTTARIAVRRGRRRRRRALALLAAAAAFLGTAVFWLSASGSSGLGISAPPGPSAGNVADVTPLTTSVTRSNGAARLQSGLAISKVAVAKDYAHKIRLTVAWTNVVQSKPPLSPTGTAQIRIGLYYPIHTGACTGSAGADITLLNVDEDGGGTPEFCAGFPSTGLATGSSSVGDGVLMLSSRTSVSGHLNAQVAAPASPATCIGIGSGTSSRDAPWCQPSSADADTRILYVLASITNPAGKVPPGLSSQSFEDINFFVQVRRFELAP